MAPQAMAPLPPRLKHRAEFLAAAKGRKAPVGGLVLQVLPRTDTDPARLGFTVTKKVGNAVVRNRTRRRLKEAARLVLADAPVAGHDLVLIGRASTRGRRFDLLMADFRQALRRAGV
jgi:ribonuclease P protein component